MKILYFITKTETGGAQTHVSQLMHYFFNNENQVGLSSYPGGWLQKEAEKIGVKFFENKYFKNSLSPINLFLAMKKIKKTVKDFQPDIIHCHSSVASLAVRLAIRNKIPTIYTAHGWDFAPYRNIFRRLVAWFSEKIASNYCVKLICVSEFIKKLALDFKISSKEKMEVIYNGTEIKNEMKNFPINDIKIIGFVARLDEPKNPLLFIKIISRLYEKYPDKFIVKIYGDGPLRSKIEKKILDLKLKKIINLMGDLKPEDLKKEYEKMDLFVLISKWESFGLTTLEAMSYGIPVVVSNVGGLKEFVKENCGYLANNEEEFLLQIEKLLLNDSLRKEMGKNALDLVNKQFDVNIMLEKINIIYNKVV